MSAFEKSITPVTHLIHAKFVVSHVLNVFRVCQIGLTFFNVLFWGFQFQIVLDKAIPRQMASTNA